MNEPLITEYCKLAQRIGATGGTKQERERFAELAELLKNIIKKSRTNRKQPNKK